MKTLLATIEKHIADVETQYQEECFFNYGSSRSSYLLGQLNALKQVRNDIEIAMLDETLTKMENELKGT